MSESNERDYEKEAVEDGWVPESEWKGSKEKWVDAKTFVERGEQFLPIVNARLRKERERTEKLIAEVAELKDGNRQFREFHETALAREKRERERLVTELEAARTKAVSEGDGEAFARADKQIKEIERARETSTERKPHPDMQAWLAENSWYTTDAEMAAIADGLSDVVKRENPQLAGRAFLDKLIERVKTVVPHKFSNARRETSLTEDHGNKGTRKKGRTFDDLPEDAKAACNKFCKTIPGYTKEQYLTDYVWSEQ